MKGSEGGRLGGGSGIPGLLLVVAAVPFQLRAAPGALLNTLSPPPPRSPQLVRGKGLLDALVIDESHGVSAYDICMRLMESGLLAKPTQRNIIRFAPPLTITEAQMQECLAIISKTILSFKV